MVSEMIRCGCFEQYLHWQFARFIVSSCISHSACGMNSFVERKRLTFVDPVPLNVSRTIAKNSPGPMRRSETPAQFYMSLESHNQNPCGQDGQVARTTRAT